ncbi:hypothetical protein HDV57DRAFT_233131 [Trichoderma longibrachiatum]
MSLKGVSKRPNPRGSSAGTRKGKPNHRIRPSVDECGRWNRRQRAVSRGGSRHHQHGSIASLSICICAGLAPTITGKSYPQSALGQGTAATAGTLYVQYVFCGKIPYRRSTEASSFDRVCSARRLLLDRLDMANPDPASSQFSSCEQGTHPADFWTGSIRPRRLAPRGVSAATAREARVVGA